MSVRWMVRRALDIYSEEGFGELLSRANEHFCEDDSGGEILSSEFYQPTWASSESQAILFRNDDFRYNEYFSLFGGVHKSNINLETRNSVSTVEFDVVGVTETDEFSVEVETPNEKKRLRFKNGEFNERNRLPVGVGLNNVDADSEIDLRISSYYMKDPPERTLRRKVLCSLLGADREVTPPRISLPAVRPNEADNPPIFLISVDTFRHDYLGKFDELLEALGPDAVVPSEPRTQGEATPSAHGSLFTSTHPGDHGHVLSHGPKKTRPINANLETLSTFLTERAYKCSGLVTHPYLNPERGFGKGFHRYERRQMDWGLREYDAATNVDQVIQWVNKDTEHGSGNLFYFLHLFDAHYPYILPDCLRRNSDTDIPNLEEFRELANNRAGTGIEGAVTDYLEVLRQEPPDVEHLNLDAIRNLYTQSLEYVSDQLLRLVRHLKSEGIFEDSFIVIVGDHGEEFFERKFAMHRTLYDANIRPGMIVKPPKDAGFDVPETADLIDVFPTVAYLVEEEYPDQCVGKAWQEGDKEEPRISERIWPDWYNISVEIDGVKGIFTFEQNYPYRPDEDQIRNGPVEEEYYRISDECDERVKDYTDRISNEQKDELMEAARAVMERKTPESSGERVRITDEETLEHLEKLGYK